MKQLLILFSHILLISSLAYSQTPANVDYFGSISVDCPTNLWDDVFEIEITPVSNSTELESSRDNSAFIYMPEVLAQPIDGPCAQFAEVWYTYCYEINRKRNVPAGDMLTDKQNLYSPYFTYNFLNQGISATSTCWTSGLRILKENGCPTYDVFYDDDLILEPTRIRYWMHGSDKYVSALKNRISSIQKISWNSHYSSLYNLKHWLYDHNAGEDTGGLAVMGIYKIGMTYGTIAVGHDAGLRYINHLNNSEEGSHAITIVGYNDEIHCIDAFEPFGVWDNSDRNDDDLIELWECELGALKLVDSSPFTGNFGYVYLPYSLLNSNGIVFNYAYTCILDQIDYSPNLYLKTSLDFPERDKLSCFIGYAENAGIQNPSHTTKTKIFDYQGGPHMMRGLTYSGPIDIAFDLGYYYALENGGKIFFKVVNSSNLEGTINGLTLVDKRWNEAFELNNFSVEEINGSGIISVDYHLLPHHENLITDEERVLTNRISRFSTNVKEGGSLLIEGANIDMYNSNITIEGGGLISIINSSITAKKGYCTINIKGDVTVSNAKFYVDPNAQLIINFESNNPVTIIGSEFNKTWVVNSSPSFTLDDCVLNDCNNLYSNGGNITFIHTSFLNSGIILENLYRTLDTHVLIDDCTISNSRDGIYLKDYGGYTISNCIIENCHNGIFLMESGKNLGQGVNRKIENNSIYNCSEAGILAYSSYGKISLNSIYSNYYGIKLMNFCNLEISGNQNAAFLFQTQQLSDNTNAELYISENSFPPVIKFNAIIDEDNIGKPDDALLYFDRPVYANFIKVDVTNNYWGVDFDQTLDLMGNRTYFFVDPIWSKPGFNLKNTDQAELLYSVAENMIMNNNFIDAKEHYQEIIEQFPKSKYASASIKQLLHLEKYISNDYLSLKNYFLNNDSIQNDTTLKKVAQYAANKCNVQLENWFEAIDFFENIIINGNNFADSIFAVIDRSDIYELIAIDTTTLRATNNSSSNLLNYNDLNTHYQNSKRLLSLLPLKKSNEVNIMQNRISNFNVFPNPFESNIKIAMDLDSDGIVKLGIYEVTGKKVKLVTLGFKKKGSHNLYIDDIEVPVGMYLFNLYLNEMKIQSRKVIKF